MNRTRTTHRGALLLAAALALSLGGCKKERYSEEPLPVAPGGPPSMPAAPPGMPGAPPGMPPAGGSIAQLPSSGQIAALEQTVAQYPGNLKAWIDLGNSYFDSHQPAKAIEAYGKALAIDPTNPDVLTDQGVMYRELRQFDKAIANFEKASKLDPKHVQSVFNMGVVYSSDLGETEKAIRAWNRVIESAPGSPQAAQARQLIDELKARPVVR